MGRLFANSLPVKARLALVASLAVAVIVLAIVLLSRRSARPPAAQTGQEPPQAGDITLQDLFSQRDIDGWGPRVREKSIGLVWLPFDPEYVAAHAAQPELPDMRPEFGIWLKSLLASTWLPDDLATSAPYLRVGAAWESRFRSCFYALYARLATTFMVKGYLDRVEVTIKPAAPTLSSALAASFQKAARLDEARPPGALGAGHEYQDETGELGPHLRSLAERYINPVSWPKSESEWARILSRITRYNGGFKINWSTDGYVRYSPDGRPITGGRPSPTLWTNGRAIRLTVSHDDRWVHSFQSFFDSFPQPVPVTVPALNPQAVEFWDAQEWANDESGPVSDPERATRGTIEIAVKAPFAPAVTAEEGGKWPGGGQPSWQRQVILPMDPLKWHIAEFATLAAASELSLFRGSNLYDYYFSSQFVESSDRGKLLAEARARRDTCVAVADRFASLRYPPEVQAERDEMLSALRAAAQAWDQPLAFWQPIVRDHPKETKSFYRLQGEALERQLAAAGPAHIAERIHKAANCSRPLFRELGMQ